MIASSLRSDDRRLSDEPLVPARTCSTLRIEQVQRFGVGRLLSCYDVGPATVRSLNIGLRELGYAPIDGGDPYACLVRAKATAAAISPSDFGIEGVPG